MSRNLITQKEVAEQLGVSVATVSRVLNDRPGVGPELRQKILDTLNEMDYTPNLTARGLAIAQTHAVAFVVHMSSQAAAGDPFYSTIMAGAEAYLARHNYHILLTTVEDQLMARPEAFSVIRQGRVDGLIVAGPDISPTFILHLLAAGVPLVLIDNCLAQSAVNCVLADNKGGMYDATRHLQEHEHGRIAFLSGPESWISNRERVQGYRQAMVEAGLEPLILHAEETTIAAGEALMQQALEQWPDVTAVGAVNDAVAIGAVRAANRLGRQVPEDLAVIGFDDITWAVMNEPSLSTVHVFKRRMGKLAGQRLLECIQEPETAPTRTIVATELVLRQSCGHANKDIFRG
jgi:DNA-binding LacI/PurR family transcriptional regulator